MGDVVNLADYKKKKEGEKAEKPKAPEYIAEHKKLYEHANELTDTGVQSLSRGYLEFVEGLRDEKTGRINFKQLDDGKILKKKLKVMTDIYKDEAEQYFGAGLGKELNDFERKLLMQAYLGVHEGFFIDRAKALGSKFTHAQFDHLKGQIKDQLQDRLYGAAGDHLQDHNIDDILKYTKVDKLVDKSTGINVTDARKILEEYHEAGAVTDAGLRKILGSYKVKGKKQQDKEEKEHADAQMQKAA